MPAGGGAAARHGPWDFVSCTVEYSAANQSVSAALGRLPWLVRDLKILRTRLVQFSGLVQLVDEAVLELRARETDLRAARAPEKGQETERHPEKTEAKETPSRSRCAGEAAQTIADQELTIFYLRQKVERLRERLAAGGADPGDGDELFRAQTEARFYEQMNAELVAERQALREESARGAERVSALEAQAETDRRRIEELTRRAEAQERLAEELRAQTRELRQVVERQAADGLAHFRTEQEAETLRRQVAQLEEQRTRYLDHIQEIELQMSATKQENAALSRDARLATEKYERLRSRVRDLLLADKSQLARLRGQTERVWEENQELHERLSLRQKLAAAPPPELEELAGDERPDLEGADYQTKLAEWKRRAAREAEQPRAQSD